MSQKSSLTQSDHSVRQALTAYSLALVPPVAATAAGVTQVYVCCKTAKFLKFAEVLIFVGPVCPPVFFPLLPTKSFFALGVHLANQRPANLYFSPARVQRSVGP